MENKINSVSGFLGEILDKTQLNFEPPLKIRDYNDPILRQKCENFNFKNPQIDIVQFSTDLVETMYKKRGIGLAANQVGVPLKIFAMHADPALVVINPRIIEVSEEVVLLEEGCLSYPGLYVKVKRPLWIKARFNYPNGQAKTFRFEGMTARVFQHEFAHLEGLNMLDFTNKFYKDKAEKVLAAREKALKKIEKVIA